MRSRQSSLLSGFVHCSLETAKYLVSVNTVPCCCQIVWHNNYAMNILIAVAVEAGTCMHSFISVMSIDMCFSCFNFKWTQWPAGQLAHTPVDSIIPCRIETNKTHAIISLRPFLAPTKWYHVDRPTHTGPDPKFIDVHLVLLLFRISGWAGSN